MAPVRSVRWNAGRKLGPDLAQVAAQDGEQASWHPVPCSSSRIRTPLSFGKPAATSDLRLVLIEATQALPEFIDVYITVAVNHLSGADTRAKSYSKSWRRVRDSTRGGGFADPLGRVFPAPAGAWSVFNWRPPLTTGDDAQRLANGGNDGGTNARVRAS